MFVDAMGSSICAGRVSIQLGIVLSSDSMIIVGFNKYGVVEPSGRMILLDDG
jgi:hypothetical protein